MIEIVAQIQFCLCAEKYYLDISHNGLVPETYDYWQKYDKVDGCFFFFDSTKTDGLIKAASGSSIVVY